MSAGSLVRVPVVVIVPVVSVLVIVHLLRGLVVRGGWSVLRIGPVSNKEVSCRRTVVRLAPHRARDVPRTVEVVCAAGPLPLELVVSGREITEPRISPDGTCVAFVHRRGSAAAISVVGVDPSSPEQLVTFGPDPSPGRGMGGGCFTWLPTSDGIVHAARDGELWLVQGATLERLTVHGRSCRAPAAAGTLVGYVVDEAEVWLVDLATGDHRRLDDGRHEFCFDPTIAPDGTVVSWIGWSPPAMPWDAAERVDARLDDGRNAISTWRPPGGAVQQARFASGGESVCVHDGSGWVNLHVAGRPVLAEEAEHGAPTWGMGQRSYAMRDDGAAILARNTDGFGSLVVVEPNGEVTDVAPGFVGVHGQLSVAGATIGALRAGPSTPPEVVVIDEAATERAVTRVVATSGVAAWQNVTVPAPEAVVAEHDGIVLHARRHRAPRGTGRLLCWVHGGPTDQWQTDFRPRIAYWCSRGWDVLVVDPRGTTGHGRSYQRALNGAWGRLDVDDTAALIAHAHRCGWASPATTVMIGGSSGGLTVLGVLADHPELVAGGIASYPVSDLVALADATHRFEAHYTETLVGPRGAPETVEAMQRLSPIHRADRIRGPLLVFHGTDDPVVPFRQSEQLVRNIGVAGGDVELVAYDGEGHGFRDPENQRDEYQRIEAFLARIPAGF
jgi:dipeptidyl aminopeptidase/acylaminoacyl peptidase